MRLFWVLKSISIMISYLQKLILLTIYITYKKRGLSDLISNKNHKKCHKSKLITKVSQQLGSDNAYVLYNRQ